MEQDITPQALRTSENTENARKRARLLDVSREIEHLLSLYPDMSSDTNFTLFKQTVALYLETIELGSIQESQIQDQEKTLTHYQTTLQEALAKRQGRGY